MESFHEYVNEYKKQIEKGAIREVYKGLLNYIMDLRTHFKNKYPEYSAGGMYLGYMDMTYFPLFPEALKRRKMKIAVVFIHDTFRFEAWLVGQNKQVQTRYWKLFKENNWDKYRIPSTIKGADSIMECTLVDTPGFNDLDTLTAQIESETLNFIRDIKDFLSKQSGSGWI